jgi:UDP-glucose-4-epimerase GalE
MAVLVTGGAGYIGSHTVRQLVARGSAVVVLDSMEYGNAPAIVGTPLVVGDIADRELVAKTIVEHGIDSIVHFAAYKNVGESMHSPAKYFDNNVAKTAALLDVAQTNGVQSFVFSSSCSVYGTPKVVPVDESAAIGPESTYAATKAICEEMLKWYSVVHGLRFASLRYFNAAGAAMDGSIGEDWAQSQNLIPVVMKALLGFAPAIKVFGDDYPTPDGTCIRDYIHVDDLADAHLAALDHLAGGGASAAFNCGTGTGSSVKQVIEMAERVSGRPVPHEYVARRAGDPVSTYADNAFVKSTLGWDPKYGLEEIVQSAWNWHSTHPDGYES